MVAAISTFIPFRRSRRRLVPPSWPRRPRRARGRRGRPVVGNLALDEPEGIAVLGVQPPAASLGGDPGACDDVVVVGEHGDRHELDGPRRFISQASEDLDEPVDAVEFAGNAGATRDPVNEVWTHVLADGCHVVAVEGVDGGEVGEGVGGEDPTWSAALRFVIFSGRRDKCRWATSASSRVSISLSIVGDAPSGKDGL
jgi:hypothetical protein